LETNLKSKFCFLEKDSKTFNILKKYMEDYVTSKNLLDEDSEIQYEEIKAHNRNLRKQEDDKLESLEWIAKYGKSERVYLNTIKYALSLLIESDADLNWENFCYIVDKYNKRYKPILDLIF